MKLRKVLAMVLCVAMVLSTMSFSVFASEEPVGELEISLAEEVSTDAAQYWSGKADTTWYNETDTEFTITTAEQLAGLAKLVDEANEDSAYVVYDEENECYLAFKDVTIKLGASIDLYAKENGEPICFQPIGSYRQDKAFAGTFDGQGHTIGNLYQNTWALNNGYYYSDLGLGLFGLVQDATIKNLKINGADISGESAICGTIAACAYGESTFENITVSNANVADYQYYAGGVVGWASGNNKYINCDVDETTTVAAQWGDFDNSTGGVIGGCGGSATILMKDCDVACRIDAYSDVTSSYQWYAYRRCGMLIGNPGNTAVLGNTTYAVAPQLTIDNCNVTFGEWANYTYCEFAGTSWPWVRVQAGISNSAYSNPRYGHPTDANGNEVVDDNHTHNDGEGHNVLIAFNQLFGGGQGVYGSSKDVLEEIGGYESITETLEIDNIAEEARTVAELFTVASTFSGESVELVSVGKFGTLQEAIDAIASNEGEYVIKVLKNIEEDVTVTQYTNQKITIEGDEDNKPVIKGQVNVNGRSNGEEGEALTLKNLVFDAAGAETASIYALGADTSERYIMNLTVDSCDFMTTGEAKKLPAIKTATNGNKNWTITNSTATDLHSLLQTKRIDGLVIDGCTVDCKNGINLDNSTDIQIKNSTINTDGYGVRIGEQGDSTEDRNLTLENNKITTTEEGAIVIRRGAEYSTVNVTSGTYESENASAIVFGDSKPFRGIENLDLNISGGAYSSSSINVASAAEGVEASYDLEGFLAEGLQVSVNEYGYYTPVADNAGTGIILSVATEITASLVPVDGNPNKFDVVLTANEGAEIHRFLSAELNIKFKDEDTTPLSIKSVVGNADYGIEVINPDYNESGVWGFHLDDKAIEATGNKLTIATVELMGYGKGELIIAPHANNKVEAIQSVDNNNVKGYLVTNTEDGILVIDNIIHPVDLKVPTKDLTIEITFPNAIKDQVAAYQDMKVVVDGDDIDAIETELGLGACELVVDGDIVQYVVTIKEELTENNSYNITVTGAGYRTADYRVTMTEDKIVYFWNNATKEGNEKEIEIGVSKPVKATFLAGDIAEDNIIDKYDLAAVVSYFGRYNLNVANAEGVYENAKYARYDLNRDGNIDSEDIAYVLASFGY